MALSKQDRELAKAAVALYRAAELGCVPDSRDTDEEFANFCIKTVSDYMESFDYCCPDDMQAIADYVYSAFQLDHSKIR